MKDKLSLYFSYPIIVEFDARGRHNFAISSVCPESSGQLFAGIRASFYSRLPAGHNESAGFLAQFSCKVVACIIFNCCFKL